MLHVDSENYSLNESHITANRLRFEIIQHSCCLFHTKLVRKLCQNTQWNISEYPILCLTHLHVCYLKLPGLQRKKYEKCMKSFCVSLVGNSAPTFIIESVQAVSLSLQSGLPFEQLAQINPKHKHKASNPSELCSGRNWKQWLTFPHSNTAPITLPHTHSQRRKHTLRYAHMNVHNNPTHNHTQIPHFLAQCSP